MPLMIPSAERIEQAQLTDFLGWLDREKGVKLADYWQLWRWSTENLEDFWAAVWDYCEIESEDGYRQVLSSKEMPGARWFEGARVSYVEHLLRGRNDSEVAIKASSEDGPLRTWTWGQLRDEAGRIAAGLERYEVAEGDRVASCLPNIPEAVAAFMACASIGAVWTSTSPDFGIESTVDRFAQVEPKLLLGVDGYKYGGRDFDCRGKLTEIISSLPSLEHAVVLPSLGLEPADGTIPWDELRATPAPLQPRRLDFSHPLWILYSSGTTGRPKAIVHSQGSILIESAKNVALQMDLGPDDCVFWFTTTGWMMWNFLVGVIISGASIVLYDGKPTHPGPERLWDLAEEAGVTVFGTSAAYLASCADRGMQPAAGRDLSKLKAIGSTGSPLPATAFDWVYEAFAKDTWLFSSSGGTDICSTIVGGVPTLPVYRGEIQAPALAVDIQAWDGDGKPHIGQMGELVVTQPMPTMPIYFWGDPGDLRYKEAYFAEYPGVWRHGDWIELTERGTAIIHGRSDATVNRGGIRIGTSEIYGAALSIAGLADALAVDIPLEGTHGRLYLFVQMSEGAELTEQMIAEIRSGIAKQCTPRHVPDEIVEVPEVPRTLTGKLLEVPVKRLLMGFDPDAVLDRSALANPASVNWFLDFRSEVPDKAG